MCHRVAIALRAVRLRNLWSRFSLFTFVSDEISICLFRLVGRYPFLDSDPLSLFAKISRCQFTLPDTLSSESRDLLRNLLRHQPSQRLTARDILDHPWLRRQGWFRSRSIFASSERNKTLP